MRLGVPCLLASGLLVALGAATALAENLETTPPAMAVDGQSLYVTSGGLQQFMLSANGPVWLRSVPTNGTARSVVGVASGDEGKATSQGGGHTRLAVTGEFTLTVFEAAGTQTPSPMWVRTWPAGDLWERLLAPATLGDQVVLGMDRYDGVHIWQSTDLTDPITFHGLMTGFTRGPVATGWGRDRGRTVVSYNEYPLGGVGGGTVAILHPEATGWRERFTPSRAVGGAAGPMLVHDGRAYVEVREQRGSEWVLVLATIDLSDPTLAVRSRVDRLPLTTVVGGLGLGLVDDRLAVSSLADPDHPVEISSARTAGLGVDVQPIPGGTTELGPDHHAAVLSESHGNLWLEVFRVSGADVPLRIRTPVLVPAWQEAPRLVAARVFMPRAAAGGPSARTQNRIEAHTGAAVGGPAQPVPMTATPVVPAGPPISLAGEWSITRTYWRSCPRCGNTVIRTTPWEIAQTGADVRVDRGLRGVVTGSGPALLTLEGTESEGFGVQRFWYATLRVSADGRYLEGAFNGSETMQNPCGSDPPQVTCLVSAGWLRAVRVSGGGPPLPTPAPVVTDTPTPRPIAPAPVSTATGVATSVLDFTAVTRAFIPIAVAP